MGVASFSRFEESRMRKLILAFLLPKVVSYLRRRYAGRSGRPTA
jgi:hypothetical protein